MDEAELIRAREFVTHVIRDIFHQDTGAATIEKAAREIAKAMSRVTIPSLTTKGATNDARPV